MGSECVAKVAKVCEYFCHVLRVAKKKAERGREGQMYLVWVTFSRSTEGKGKKGRVDDLWSGFENLGTERK